MPFLLCWAQAANLWDGEWFVDRAKSHAACSTFSISSLPDGAWKYACADDFFLFSPTGSASAHAGFQADTQVTCIHLTATTLDYVESTFGKEKLRRHMTLAGDGGTPSIHDVETQADGVLAPSGRIAVRTGRTSGLGGTWKIVVDEEKAKRVALSAAKSQASPAVEAKPTLVVFTATDGLTTWHFPFSGEVIRGYADGQRRPITGPLMASNLTFTWTPINSPNRVQFVGR